MRDLDQIIEAARQQVAVAANAALTTLYWQLGNRVRAEVLEGRRAEYGARIVSALRRQLTRSHFKQLIYIPDDLKRTFYVEMRRIVSHFVGGKGPDAKTAAIAFYSLRHSFGWPIAISYALRNHFLHDGAGGDFFAGPTAASAFKVSAAGWARVEEQVKEYNVNTAHSRLGNAWTHSAGDDLRKILDTCAPEIDEALGVLVGSACQIAMAHVGFMLGED